MSPRTNRILTAVIFAVLWTVGMLWRSPSIDLQTVGTAVVVGVIVALLVYWLLDKFSGRPRG
jgi:tryptophan-rich sensory protein